MVHGSKIRSTDNNPALRQKLKHVQRIVHQELDFAETIHNTTTNNNHKRRKKIDYYNYLYIQNKRVVGLLVAEQIDRAYALQQGDPQQQQQQHQCYSTGMTSTKAILGIYQLWVHDKFRQQGIATRLVTAAREKMIFGLVVPASQTAFSSPTESGIAFARRYQKNTGGISVLVYDCRNDEAAVDAEWIS